MSLCKKSVGLAGLVWLAVISASAMADQCGNPPVVPELPHGAKATMDDLVAGSQAVKTYITEADEYLDCQDARATSGEVEAMSKSDKEAWTKGRGEVLKARNEIADKFNAEVAAYQKANQ